MDYFEQFHESQLPPKDASYSSLREEDISKTDYPHVQRVLNHFYMADLGVYHNFYLLTNVLVTGGCVREFQRHLPPTLWS